jgi:hypothetical protein
MMWQRGGLRYRPGLTSYPSVDRTEGFSSSGARLKAGEGESVGFTECPTTDR